MQNISVDLPNVESVTSLLLLARLVLVDEEEKTVACIFFDFFVLLCVHVP